MSNIKFIERLHFFKQLYTKEVYWRKVQGVKLNRLVLAFGCWMDAADKKVIKSKDDLIEMIEKEIKYKNMNGEKSYIYDLLEVMKQGSEVHNGCIIKRVGYVFSWNGFQSENPADVKKYIDEALLSLNKSIKS